MKMIWVVPEKQGGIQTYSESLWPIVAQAWKREGLGELEDPIYPDLKTPWSLKESIDLLLEANPDLVHVQHEFGLFGYNKTPPFYQFPSWLRRE